MCRYDTKETRLPREREGRSVCRMARIELCSQIGHNKGSRCVGWLMGGGLGSRWKITYLERGFICGPQMIDNLPLAH